MSKYVGVVFPVKIVPDSYFNKVTDIFGIRKWRKEKYGGTGMHSGIDLGTPLGTSVKSPYRGIVTRVSYEVKNAGNVLKIKHDDGFETQYLHLQSILVNEGDEVKSGQKVALTGNSDGNTERSTGPHLHFEVHVNSKKVDPAPYLYGYSLEDGRIINGKQQFVPSKNTVFDKRAIANLNDVKIDGSKISSKQTENANTIVNVCKDLGGSKRDAIIAIATALQESRLMNLNYGDRDSVGLFQQRTSQGWGSISQITNPTYSATAFFNGAGTNKGLFDYKGRNSVSIAKAAQWVQKSAYPDAYAKWEDEATKIVDYLWGDIVDSFLNEYATESDKNTREEVKIEDYLASGIWQIIKVVIDPEVVDKQINDATIAFTQGSLYNFFEKVCQKPFVEFWGDTYGDQYYFIIRKPPFTRKSFLSLKTINISERDVISDSISWSNDTIYSWYQLNPNGNYIGANESLYTYLTAVFFPEYAEIWGSRPLSITSNYITFIKETDNVQMEAVLQDLKFLIDIHSYLPFTRQGTITINGDRRIKRGMRIHYLPTDEYFYVE
ncbi:MAG TPA: M23 family metallopeptidase [Bacteroidales bacterium]|nr:M23 family metallopeptidase [Bacteroidales bacterium]